jgi:hypothetical protein
MRNEVTMLFPLEAVLSVTAIVIHSEELLVFSLYFWSHVVVVAFYHIHVY